MPRNYVTIDGTVQIDSVLREKDIAIYEGATLIGKGKSSASTGAYSFSALKERNSLLTGVAYTDYGTQWAASKAYALNDRVLPVTYNGHWYACTTAGTSGATEPSWPTNGSTVNDGTAVWTDMGTIEQPIARGPYQVNDPAIDANVVHLVRFQETVPREEVTGALPLIYADLTRSTTIKKFGESSVQFNGTTSQCRFAPIAAAHFNGNYTIDIWVYIAAAPGGSARPLFYWGDLSLSQFRVQISTTTDQKIDFYHEYSGSPGTYPITTNQYPLNQWFLVSAERFNNKMYLYINGVLAAPIADVPTTALGLNGSHYTFHGSGRTAGAHNFLPGYLGETRVSNVGRYGGVGFTVPSNPYTL